ncbi:hypothetical protein [Flaviaesturariibacter amylovorans]|uniref:DUF998 domain-containing protein n=1 Tax=Flaviaesturariibacter amylovorans TaxID=1084520 RepID=A0ABP8HR50_9BACT
MPLLRLPVVAGCLLYVLLYGLATLRYPGGTHADPQAPGFSWMQNYWCNLLDATALNGAPNTARPVALLATGVLAATLLLFWWGFAGRALVQRPLRRAMRACGIAAMAVAAMLPFGPHDPVLYTASTLGLVPLAGTYIGLCHLGERALLRAGLVVIALIAANNLCYHTPGLFGYLALVQKLTFLYFLGWTALVEVRTAPSTA